VTAGGGAARSIRCRKPPPAHEHASATEFDSALGRLNAVDVIPDVVVVPDGIGPVDVVRPERERANAETIVSFREHARWRGLFGHVDSEEDASGLSRAPAKDSALRRPTQRARQVGEESVVYRGHPALGPPDLSPLVRLLSAECVETAAAPVHAIRSEIATPLRVLGRHGSAHCKEPGPVGPKGDLGIAG
jgi:hypothetical protein